MKLGVIMLVHNALDRAEQTIRHWVAGGCPVVVHVDGKVSAADYVTFVDALSDLPMCGSQSGTNATGGPGRW